MTKKAAQPESPVSRYVHEIWGILFFILGFFVFLTLLSYSPRDPSLNSSATQNIQNFGGIVGSYLANFLITSLGFAAYLIGGIFLLSATLCFRRRKDSLSVPNLALLTVFLLSVAIFLELAFREVSFHGYPILAGGLIGHLLGDQLRHYFSEVGSYLIVLTLSLLTFLWATQLSFVKILQVVAKNLQLLGRKVLSFATIYWARFNKALNKRSAATGRNEKSAEKISNPRITLPLENSKKITGDIPTPPLAAARVESKNIRFPEEPKIHVRLPVKAESTHEKNSQLQLSQMSENFELPALALLDPVPASAARTSLDEDSLKASSILLESKLRDYSVEGRVTEIHPGPVVTMYEFEPAAGVKVNKITNLSDDLSLSMSGRPVRIVAPLPGKPAVGIEIPNMERETVFFKEIVMDSRFQKSDFKLALALGKNIEGEPVITDLAKMPHLLVAGATGAGKSVGLNSFILSLLLKNTPEDVRFIFIDPKMLELSIYADIPHLLLPVVTQPKKATAALIWAVKEMERRYRLLSDAAVRNISSYNKKLEQGGFADYKPKPKIEGSDEDPIVHDQRLPYIVIIIDELADLMMVSGREVEEYITRLAQMARAAGIHMILATQRPSVDVITGIIKANFPSRISFKVTSKHDSRTILDTIGAEHLLGNGDMLFIPPGLSKQIRVHGAYVSDQEISRIVKHVREQGKPIYNEELLNMKISSQDIPGLEDEESDELYDQAVAIVTESRQASISMVQRRLRIGYNRSARLIEKMEAEGIVSAPMGSKGREVLARAYNGDE